MHAFYLRERAAYPAYHDWGCRLMPAGKVTVRCPVCSRTWAVEPRADGTYPATARCAKGRGGCGRTGIKVPRPSDAKAVAVPSATTVVAWDPPSAPRGPRYAEPCPVDGHGRLVASPRGTIRACTQCGGRVTPPGALTPYNRDGAAVRQVKSQRENDLAALDLAGRKGVMLGELRELTASGKLDDAGVMKAEWFAEQVKAAASLARLDELITLFSEAGPRPRHWGQPRPALTGTATDEDEDEYSGQADDAPVVLAAPASIAAQQHRAQSGRMTWAGALAALGWRLAAPGGSCQVIDEQGQRCPAESTSPAVPDGRGGSAWLCGWHYATLGGAISDDYRRRQTA